MAQFLRLLASSTVPPLAFCIGVVLGATGMAGWPRAGCLAALRHTEVAVGCGPLGGLGLGARWFGAGGYVPTEAGLILIGLLVTGALGLGLPALRRPRAYRWWLAGLLGALGLLWFEFNAQGVRAQWLAPRFDGATVKVWLTIEGPVRCGPAGCRFFARPGCTPGKVSSSGQSRTARHTGPIPQSALEASLPRRIYVRWSVENRVPDSLTSGACRQLALRLNAPVARQNFAGFDFARWLFSKRVGALAYVRPHPDNLQEAQGVSASLTNLRSKLRAALALRVREALEGQHAEPLVLALGLGQRDSLDEATKSLLQRTGTVHLFVVSGLHIGMVAVAFERMMRWAALPLRERWPYPVQRLTLPLGLLAAGGYALLAGGGVSALRAWLMAALALFVLLGGRRGGALLRVTWAAMLVLVADPLAVLGSAFWLSFGAVVTLFLIVKLLPRRRVGPPGPARRAGRHGVGRSLARPARPGLARAHARMRAAIGALFSIVGRCGNFVGFSLAVSLAMLPLTGLVFGTVPLTAPVANLLAIPLVSLLLLPLTLVALALLALPAPPWLASGVSVLVHMLASVLGATWQALLVWLHWLGEIDWAQYEVSALGPAGMAVATLVLVLGVLPIPRTQRVVLLGVLVWALVRSRAPVPAPGTFQLTMLDVGQGLAVLVRTHRHILVYDTGGATRGVAVAATTVVPQLKRHGYKRLDRMLLSHRDLDHRGGWPEIAATFPVETLMTNPGFARETGLATCHAGQRWRWDEVSFEVIWPPADAALVRNDASCVLRVRGAQGQRALLTGDIEARAEAALLAAAPEALAAEVVVVPHHGSLTSSSAAFVAAVDPDFALISAGRNNRFGLPRAAISERWRQAGACVLVSAEVGAVRLRLADTIDLATASDRRRPWRISRPPACANVPRD